MSPGMQEEPLSAIALDIFKSALDACNIPAAFDRHMHFEDRTLVLHPSPVLEPEKFDLNMYKKVLVIAFGKAALTMTEALLDRLPPGLNVGGVCSAPTVPKEQSKQIRYFAGGHPVPNRDSFSAARASLALLKRAKEDSFVFFLISGGGSAMHELPLDKTISLEDTILFHEALVASGASITEINTVRKYFSAVKGGRLALAAPNAEKISFLLADVPIKDLGAVASSPTLPDKSSPEECRQILRQYRLLENFPVRVREYFRALGLDENGATTEAHSTAGRSGITKRLALRLPVSRPISKADPLAAFRDSHFDTLLSNHDFVNAARDRAHALGFKVIIDNTCDDWDYEEASRYLMERFHVLRKQHDRVCLLSSGEVTVKLGPVHGCGGRNQQFVLKTALDLARYDAEHLAVLSAGSDGIDGDSPAAGATADTTTVARARSYNFDPVETLARFDTCTLFTALGDSIVTGPTGNNLRDLRVLLAAR